MTGQNVGRGSGSEHSLRKPPPECTDISLRVFVADFHEIVRVGLGHALKSAGMRVVGESASALDTIRRIPSLRPHVAVIDDELRDGNGPWLCARISLLSPDTRCVILTRQPSGQGMIAAAVSGAAGYLSKESAVSELIRAVHRATAGELSFPPRPPTDQGRSPRDEVSHPQPPEEWDRLSHQERQVVLHLGQGLSNRQIAQSMDLAEKTVKNYLTAILAKTGLTHRTEVAILAVRYEITAPWFFSNRGAGPITNILAALSAREDLGPRFAAALVERAVREGNTTMEKLAVDVSSIIANHPKASRLSTALKISPEASHDTDRTQHTDAPL